MSISKGKEKSDAVKFLESLDGPLTFSALLESIRLCDEVSQAAFAETLGISRSHLCDIEKGRKAVSPLRASQFAKILGYSEHQFIQLALQDQVDRAGLDVKVELSAA